MSKSRHAKILAQLDELSFALEVYTKVPAMIAVYSVKTGEYIYVNESVSQLLGYKPDDFIEGGTQFVAGLVHPDDAPRIMASNAKALKEANDKKHSTGKREPIATFEYRMKHKNGSWRWLHSDGTIFDRDKHGKVEHVMNVSVDITTRRAAEDAAKQALHTEIDNRKRKEKELEEARKRISASEERYLAFIQNSNEGIWRVALEKPIPISLSPTRQIKMMYRHGYLAEANQAMAKMYGLRSAKELLGVRLTDLLVQSDPRNTEYLTAFIKSGYKLSGFESHEQDPVGNKKVFRNSLVGTIENGCLLHAWGTQQDITTESEFSEIIERNEEHLSLALQAAKMGTWEWNLEDNTFVWSDEIKRLYGVPHDFELSIESIQQFNNPEDTERVMRLTNHAIKSGKPYELEYRIIRQDGSEHWVAAYGQVFKQKGRPSRLIGTLQNIDETKAREERLAMAISAGKIATWDWDLLTGKIERSAEYHRLLGVSEQELPPTHGAYLKLIHPDDRKDTVREVRRSIREKQRFDITYRVIKPNGSERWLTDRGKIYRNNSGKAIAVRGTCIDVTKIKNLSEQMRRDEERLALALEASQMGLWEWDVTTDVLTWSKELKRLYGLKWEDDVSYKKYISLIHPEDRAYAKDTITRAMKSGKSYTVEHRIIWPDGSTHWIQGKGRAYLRKGKPYRMLGTSISVDTRKTADIQLKQSETKFRQLFENAPDAIIVATAQGKVIDANHAAEALLGYGHDEFVRLNLPRLLKKRDLLNIRKLQRTRRSDNEYFAELELHHKQGHYVRAEITVRMLPDKTWLTFIRDVSERHKQQAAIRDAQIKEKVLQEKAALLRQQHNQIVMLNKAKDEFLSVASHHLRTPVTAVKTYLAMLRDGYVGKLNGNQMVYLEQAFESNEQQLQVIEDILNVAEIDTNQVVLKLEKFDVVRLAKDVTDNLDEKFRSRNQRVHFKTSEPVIKTKLDRVKFSLVLENLIGNASKYSPDGTQIFVRIAELKNTVKIVVTDKGMGIAEEDRDKIFEKFARVRNQFYQSETGTGLGLYWAKRIVELHEGSIKLDSKIKKGSAFTIVIPKR